MDTDAIIVGAGHNGMVAAWYLARAGLRASVSERRAFVGGAAITQQLRHGFHFSAAGQHPGGEVSGQPGHNAAHQALRDLR